MDLVNIFTLIGAFLFVLALMAGMGWVLKKYGTKLSGLGVREGKSLKVIETLVLDPRRRLHIVKAGEKKYILLTGPNTDLVVDNDAKLDIDLES